MRRFFWYELNGKEFCDSVWSSTLLVEGEVAFWIDADAVIVEVV